MENLRLYEAEVDYTSEKDTHEYPTVSYCKENDTVYYMSNAKTFDIHFYGKHVWSYVSPYVTAETMTFEYKEGMTWGEWCESEYNTVGIYPSDDGQLIGAFESYGASWVGRQEYGEDEVSSSDVITSQLYYMGYAG